jgi:hypothetical protein
VLRRLLHTLLRQQFHCGNVLAGFLPLGEVRAGASPCAILGHHVVDVDFLGVPYGLKNLPYKFAV